MLVDIGANLTHESFDSDLQAVIDSAFEASISYMLITGIDVAHSKQAFNLAQMDKRLFSTIGLHPNWADMDQIPALTEMMKQYVNHPKVKAWGEMGLDFYRDFRPEQTQIKVFEAQLELAHQMPKALFLHEREAFKTLYAMLKQNIRDYPAPFVIHCFTGEKDALKAYLDLGAYIGMTGFICDKKRGMHLQELLAYIPSDRLLVETDAPYLLPHFLRNQIKSNRNEPRFLKEIVAFMADILNKSETLLAQETQINACRFLELDKSI